MNIRTFMALELPQVHKEAIVQYVDTWSRIYRQGMNWVKPQNLHLTLLFLGDTRMGDLPQMQQAMGEMLIRTKAMRLQLLGFELYPAVEPRLLWVKLMAEDKSVFRLAKDLNGLVREFDYQPQSRPLQLHITAARIKQQQSVPAEREFMGAALPQEYAVYDTITYYQSVLKPDGPVYTVLSQYELRR